MCGIAGYIGKSTKPKLTYRLATSLFEVSEMRGIDASGLWGAEIGAEGRVFYNKEPQRSSKYIQNSFWTGMKTPKLDVLLMHARAASKGGQHAKDNNNNHPFVSTDCRLGMVHNGNIEEADFLKEKYQIESDTDSEFLLRIYEQALQETPVEILNAPDEVLKRANAISKIWSVISSGAMSVALGERNGETRYLSLFHNDKRPLWLADLRKTLGQVFFFSSPEIWYQATTSDKELFKIEWQDCKLINIPVNQIWMFELVPDDEIKLYKFDVSVNDFGNYWEKGDFCKIPMKKQTINVVTSFDKPESKLCGLNESCDAIIKIVEDIRTDVTNLVNEGSITQKECHEIVNCLHQNMLDLQGTSVIYL